MGSLYVDRRGAELDYEPDRLVVRVRGERYGTVPLATLTRVVVRSHATLSARLLNALWERGIALFVLSGHGRHGARLVPRDRRGLALRLGQYALLADEPARAAFARELVRAKISGQHRLLERSRGHARDPRTMERALETLARTLAIIAEETPGRGRLRGLEGAAARHYFAAWATLLPASLGFSGRARRPPPDPVNAALSLAYTLLHHDAVRTVEEHGLDPWLGVYHDPAPGRESLACDLVEPLRPGVDRFVLDLFREGDLKRRDFARRDDGLFLRKETRSAFYRAYEQAAASWRRLLRRTTGLLAHELARRGAPALPSAEKRR